MTQHRIDQLSKHAVHPVQEQGFHTWERVAR